MAPVIRVAWNDPALIKKALDKKALDMGAVGIMVPQVQNAADEAKAAVDAARYYPEATPAAAFRLPGLPSRAWVWTLQCSNRSSRRPL